MLFDFNKTGSQICWDMAIFTQTTSIVGEQYMIGCMCELVAIFYALPNQLLWQHQYQL